jgi:hypothetical protein
MASRKVNVAIVGLGFGKEFIPIYQCHPDGEMYSICQRTKERLDEVGDQFHVAKRYTSFDDLIADPAVDAVHINSPIHLHAPQSIAALKAGKHVACTVPAATTVEECAAIVAAAVASGKNYMMMETAIYTREFLFIREMVETGKLGRGQEIAFEVTRSLFETARQYVESFDVYGDKVAFEWAQIEGQDPVIHVGEKPERVKVPDFARLLPEPIRRFTTKGVYDDEHAHLSFIQGGGHGGSHPHLVHEFLSSIVEGRPSFPNVYQSVNWTCAGICAHESAMRGGAMVKLPVFA